MIVAAFAHDLRSVKNQHGVYVSHGNISRYVSVHRLIGRARARPGPALATPVPYIYCLLHVLIIALKYKEWLALAPLNLVGFLTEFRVSHTNRLTRDIM